jgi:hypothetical protein
LKKKHEAEVESTLLTILEVKQIPGLWMMVMERNSTLVQGG